MLGSIRQSSKRPESVNHLSQRSHYSLKESDKSSSKEELEEEDETNSFKSDHDAEQAILEAQQEQEQESETQSVDSETVQWHNWTYEQCTLMIKRFPKMP